MPSLFGLLFYQDFSWTAVLGDSLFKKKFKNPTSWNKNLWFSKYEQQYLLSQMQTSEVTSLTLFTPYGCIWWMLKENFYSFYLRQFCPIRKFYNQFWSMLPSSLGHMRKKSQTLGLDLKKAWSGLSKALRNWSFQLYMNICGSWAF